MKLFLLTAAHDQPVGFSLAVRYVRRAVDRLPASIDCGWIVADDGQEPVYRSPFSEWKGGTLNWYRDEEPMSLQVAMLRRPPSERGIESFIGNMRELAVTLEQVAGPDDIAAVIEDDWFSADYLRDACKAMADPSLLLWGETGTRYYRLDNRRHHTFRRNDRAALSATVFRARWGATWIRTWANRSQPTIMLDDVLWRRTNVLKKILLPESKYVVGIKGLPGAKGLGMGCGLDERHPHDQDGSLLRQWIGDDASLYAQYMDG